LLDCYIGVTEKNNAQAFHEANENTLLLIDEVDSLLASRRGASRQWEISQVNELLTQIDDYDGYLVVATNYPEHLDDALSRRLDFKVNFQAMRPEHLEEAFVTFSTKMNLTQKQSAKAFHSSVWPTGGMTLGDFSTAFRRVSANPKVSATEFAKACLAEASHRETLAQGGRRIGF
jgi:SpoVK/Ycf46/Vps4 family AAA+-type ATPase